MRWGYLLLTVPLWPIPVAIVLHKVCPRKAASHNISLEKVREHRPVEGP